MNETLEGYMERSITNGLGYRPIRDSSRPMRDSRTISPYMTPAEIEERMSTPIEQTMEGLKSHLRLMEIETGTYQANIKRLQEKARVGRLEAIKNPESVKLRVVDPNRYTIIGRIG